MLGLLKNLLRAIGLPLANTLLAYMGILYWYKRMKLSWNTVRWTWGHHGLTLTYSNIWNIHIIYIHYWLFIKAVFMELMHKPLNCRQMNTVLACCILYLLFRVVAHCRHCIVVFFIDWYSTSITNKFWHLIFLNVTGIGTTFRPLYRWIQI